MADELDYTPKHFKLTDNLLRKIGSIEPYVFDNKIKIAVDIALTTGRPLLIAGAPGSGKSRLAEAMAAVLEWNYLNFTITSKTRIEDLTADFDHLQRLHDAHNQASDKSLKPDWAYFKPGLFWWAFNKESARRRSGNEDEAKKLEVLLDYPGIAPTKHINKTVLLIDEIDKADPDLPNDLLEPLDRRRFFDPNGKLILATPGLEILTVITTNGERELPAAFMRRCVTLVLAEPDAEKLKTIAGYHFKADEFGMDADSFAQLVESLANKTIELRTNAPKQSRRSASTSEFLDAVKAAAQLKTSLDDNTWQRVLQAIEHSILTKNLAN